MVRNLHLFWKIDAEALREGRAGHTELTPTVAYQEAKAVGNPDKK